MFLSQIPGQGMILVPVGEAVQDDIRPGHGQTTRHPKPDARVGTRHDCGFTT